MPTAEEIREVLHGEAVAPERGGVIERYTGEAARIAQDLIGYDPAFDQSGVPSMKFRAQFSLMDTEEERRGFLNRRVGKQGWTQDKFGNYALTGPGMEKLGLPSGVKPVLIDEPTIAVEDIADIAGTAGPIAGATGAGMMASGVGFLPGMAITAGGTMLGKAIQEGAEEMAGLNIQPLGEVVQDVALEGLYGALGEGVFRGILAPLGRKLMAPYASRMPEGGRELVQQAKAIGTQVKPTQVTRPAIMGRMASMIDRVFGDPLAAKNAAALNREIARIKNVTGPIVSKEGVGDTIVHSIRQSRKALSRWSNIVANKIDDTIRQSGVDPDIVPTARLKQAAAEITQALPKSAEGKPAFTAGATLTSIAEAQDLPDQITFGQMQAVAQHLWNAVDDDTIIPGISGHNARKLWRAAIDSYDDIEDKTIRQAITQFRTRYRLKINKFDNALVRRIMLEPKYAGSIAPEKIVESVFKRGNIRPIRQLKNVVRPGRWTEVQRAAMDDILSRVSGLTDDPFVEVFRGKQFRETLDSYGQETLKEMFGPDLTDQLYRLAKVTQLVTQRQAMSGGLVAANIALHPLQNVARLAKLRLMGALFRTPFAMKWLTEGLEAPNTRAGAAALGRVAAYTSFLAEQHTKGEATEFQGEGDAGGL